MSFKLTDFEEQKKLFDKQVDKLLGSHKVQREGELSEPRRHQVKLIRKCIELLDAPVDDSALQSMDNDERRKVLQNRKTENARIFTGLLLMVKNEIDTSHYFKSTDNGVFAGGLSICIGLSDDNILDPNSAANMLASAMKFLVAHVFEDANTSKPIREDHPFIKIDSFNLRQFWNRGTDMQNDYRKQVMAESEAQTQKNIADRQEVQPGYLPSFVGMFFGKEVKKEARNEVDFNPTNDR